MPELPGEPALQVHYVVISIPGDIAYMYVVKYAIISIPGDIAYVDDDGNFHVKDRLKEIIKYRSSMVSTYRTLI